MEASALVVRYGLRGGVRGLCAVAAAESRDRIWRGYVANALYAINAAVTGKGGYEMKPFDEIIGVKAKADDEKSGDQILDDLIRGRK